MCHYLVLHWQDLLPRVQHHIYQELRAALDAGHITDPIDVAMWHEVLRLPLVGVLDRTARCASRWGMTMQACAASSRTKQFATHLLMCFPHWNMIPTPLHQTVWRTWKRGPPSAYLAAWREGWLYPLWP